MIAEHWGIKRDVFSSALNPNVFFGGQSQEEFLARAFYVIEANKPLGLLIGEQGTGKTLLLKVLQREILHSGREVALIDFRGLNANALRFMTAEALGLAPRPNLSHLELQILMQRYITSLKLSQGQLVLLLDNFQLCDAGCLSVLAQFLNWSAMSHRCLSTILAGRPLENAVQQQFLLQHSAIQMLLENWTFQETRQFIGQALLNAGATSQIFQADAIKRIYMLTKGLPRSVNELCEFCLILAVDQNLSHIDARLVDEACHVLERNVMGYIAGGTVSAVA